MDIASKRKCATQKQVEYANSIAQTLGISTRFAESDGWYDVSKFISKNEEAYKNKGKERLASIRQVDFANAIADCCGIVKRFSTQNTCDYVADFISKYKDEYRRRIWRKSICETEDNEYSIDFSTETMLFICDNLYQKHGLYAFLNDNNTILYIGKSINLAERIPSSYRERKGFARISKIMYYIDDNIANVNILEILLIAENNPILNSDCKTDDIPTRFDSGIDILRDFSVLPYFGEEEEE